MFQHNVSPLVTKMATEAQVIGGHKATIHNPNTSDQAKEHSKELLKEEHNSMSRQPNIVLDIPCSHDRDLAVILDGDQAKNADHVAAGLKG